MIQQKLRLFGILLVGALVAPQANAVTISIVNGDFETGGLIDNRNSAFPGVIPTGWSAVPGAGPSGDFYGYYNPINDAGGYVSGVSGSPGITGTMAGPNVFYFGSSVSGQGIQQTLTATFLANTDYTLTVARGTRNSIFNNTLRMMLLAGSTVLTTRDVAPEPAGSRGTFLDYSTTYTYSAANAGLVGQALTIRFLEIDNPGDPRGEVDIDNVRLSGVPEPSSASLLILGLAAVLARSRRCRR
jgi:hypothetical protein